MRRRRSLTFEDFLLKCEILGDALEYEESLPHGVFKFTETIDVALWMMKDI